MARRVDEQLEEYRAKRKFDATPEPSGGSRGTEAEHEPALRFVVQEHHARALHWDLRLEQDGVLLSWALPRGVPRDPARNLLAVHTEDHPLEYLDFHGDIPAGSYGAGTMRVWDHGTYELHKRTDRELIVTLHGARVDGRYALFQTRGRDWMIHRMDPPAEPDRERVPADWRPTASRRGRLPRDPSGWAFDVAWGGMVLLVAVEDGRVRALDGDGADHTGAFPELRLFGRALGSCDAVVHGEIVIPGDDGRPDAGRLEHRQRVTPETARRHADRAPALFVATDLAFVDGHPCLAVPLPERRTRLRAVVPTGPSWTIPALALDDPAPVVAFARASGLPGVIAKRGPYRPGVTADDWRFVPVHPA
jgi:bifunctional non-homologous end joining protein LigD